VLFLQLLLKEIKADCRRKDTVHTKQGIDDAPIDTCHSGELVSLDKTNKDGNIQGCSKKEADQVWPSNFYAIF
jgi:hypothetical protein